DCGLRRGAAFRTHAVISNALRRLGALSGFWIGLEDCEAQRPRDLIGDGPYGTRSSGCWPNISCSVRNMGCASATERPPGANCDLMPHADNPPCPTARRRIAKPPVTRPK